MIHQYLLSADKFKLYQTLFEHREIWGLKIYYLSNTQRNMTIHNICQSFFICFIYKLNFSSFFQAILLSLFFILRWKVEYRRKKEVEKAQTKIKQAIMTRYNLF